MADILAPAMGDLTGAELAAKPLPGDPSKPFNPPLSKAAVEGNLEEVKRLLAGRADVNEIDQGWSTPMHRACWTNSLDVAKYLLDAKADLTLVNIVRSPGTPHAFVRLTAALFCFHASRRPTRRRRTTPKSRRSGPTTRCSSFWARTRPSTFTRMARTLLSKRFTVGRRASSHALQAPAALIQLRIGTCTGGSGHTPFGFPGTVNLK